MSNEGVFKELNSGMIRPVYLLEGEEEYYIDELADYFENQLLSESEKAFNLTVLYGKEADWATVLNACKRYPMFAERQVVMVKEAQVMKDWDKLEPYIAQPLMSTVLVLVHKHGKMDGRSKVYKTIQKLGQVVSTRKLKEDQIPEWVYGYIASKGYKISEVACMVLSEHIGADLSRLVNEMDKLMLNLEPSQAIDEDAVERYVGISKEYNVFELQKAIGLKDFPKAMKMVMYFASNPKAAPLAMLIPLLYAFFSKVYLASSYPTKSAKELAGLLSISPFFIRDYTEAARKYHLVGAERAMLFLQEYNLRSIGVYDGGTEPAELLKELVYKIMH